MWRIRGPNYKEKLGKPYSYWLQNTFPLVSGQESSIVFYTAFWNMVHPLLRMFVDTVYTRRPCIIVNAKSFSTTYTDLAFYLFDFLKIKVWFKSYWSKRFAFVSIVLDLPEDTISGTVGLWPCVEGEVAPLTQRISLQSDTITSPFEGNVSETEQDLRVQAGSEQPGWDDKGSSWQALNLGVRPIKSI